MRQGGVLSPLFFAIFIDQLVERVKSLNVGCYISTVCCSTFLYTNLIANLLELIKRRAAKNMQQLMLWIKHTWRHVITLDLCKISVHSMPQCINHVLTVNMSSDSFFYELRHFISFYLYYLYYCKMNSKIVTSRCK